MTRLYQETETSNRRAYGRQWLVKKLLMMLNELELAAIESDSEDSTEPHQRTRLRAGWNR